ncbi:MAG TPA: divergent polysaccharide deacetylase family protein [Patescibacteria group bacterium]|nr:divergent polysaccharide deacetylase family protein [Patescibacteria group bacterium]
MGWSSFPREHKRSLGLALAAFGAVAAATVGWVWLHSAATRADIESRTPRATAEIKTVYVDNLHVEATADKGVSNAVTMPPPAPGEGYVSIVITDIGMSEADTIRAIQEMPPEVALAFSPYAPALAEAIKTATDKKHEALILLPMEPANYPKDDPGPQALLMRQSDDDNARRLDAILQKADGAIGAVNFMGSALLQDEKNVGLLLSALQKRGVLFIENPQGTKSVGTETAARLRAPYLLADLRIDATASELDIQQQLLKLENLAKQRGYAVGVAQPFPVTFNMLANWTAHLSQRGIKLVPVSALWKEKERQASAAEPPPMPPGGQEQPAPPPTSPDAQPPAPAPAPAP